MALCLCAISLPSAAQVAAGSVSGTITDSTGAVIAGAKVTAESAALVQRQTTESLSTGIYRMQGLPPGTYKFTYEMQGFNTVIRDGVTLAVGVNSTLDVQLSPGTQQQSVVVTGEAPLVDTLNTYVQNTVSTQQLANLPNARDMWSMMAAQPGLSVVNRYDVGGSAAGTQTTYSAYGLRDQNRVLIDGVNTTEGTGGAGFYFDYGAFQEFQLGTAANDASMPTPGVLVNSTLKTGGNQFHGEMYADYEHQNMEGSNVSQDQLLKGVGAGTRILNYRDDNGQIGGPIKKDRVWFFVSLRDQDIKTTVTGFPVENPAGLFPFETHLQNITYKITAQLSQSQRLSSFLQWGRKFQPNRGASNINYSDSVYKQNSFSWAGNMELDSTWSPKFFTIARFTTFAYDWPNKPYVGLNGVAGAGDQVDWRRIDQNGSGNIAGGYDPYRYNRRRYAGTVDASYFIDNFLGAHHDLKFGGDTGFESLFYEQDGVRGNTVLLFNSPTGADFTVPSQVQLTNEPAVQRDKTWHNALYLQDQVRVSKKLTLNLGIRWDYYNGTEPDQTIRPDAPFRDFFYAGAPLPNGFSIPATFPDFKVPGRTVFTFSHLIVPRFGVSYDLAGDGKTVIKANFGIFRSNPATALGSDVNPIQKTTYTFVWNDLNKDKLFQPNEIGNFLSSSGGANFTVDPNIKAPTTYDTSLFVERQVSNTLSIRGGFVYKRVMHDWQLVDVARTSDLFSQKKYFCDPGEAGVPGTNNANCTWIPIYDIPNGVTVPASKGQYQTPDGNKRDFKNIEFTANKRLSKHFTLVGNFYYNWEHSLLSTDGYTAGAGVTSQASLPAGEFGYYNGIASNPNVAYNDSYHVTNWATKINGTYFAPWGIEITPAFRNQSGQPLARIVAVSSAALTPGGATSALNAGSFRMVVEPWNTHRFDNINLFDIRGEKTFKIKERFSIAGIVDLYNIFNSNKAQTNDPITGTSTAVLPDGSKNVYQRFDRPTAILAPRILRLGARFRF
jgi:hypothetical protein